MISTQESCLSKGIKRCGYHVCVLGPIGSGKTVTAKSLQDIIKKEEGQCFGFYEPVESNPLLPLYYKDPKRFAFSIQVYMLNRRYEQQLLAQDAAFCGISSVQDSSLFGDSCFVEMLKKNGTLHELEVDTYSSLFANMSRNVMYPSLVVYLNCPAEIAKQRVIKRGRECEKNISVEYLAALKAELDDFVEEFSRYTFVKEINASIDLTPDEIYKRSEEIYHDLKMTRNKPIISRIGV